MHATRQTTTHEAKTRSAADNRKTNPEQTKEHTESEAKNGETRWKNIINWGKTTISSKKTRGKTEHFCKRMGEQSVRARLQTLEDERNKTKEKEKLWREWQWLEPRSLVRRAAARLICRTTRYQLSHRNSSAKESKKDINRTNKHTYKRTNKQRSQKVTKKKTNLKGNVLFSSCLKEQSQFSSFVTLFSSFIYCFLYLNLSPRSLPFRSEITLSRGLRFASLSSRSVISIYTVSAKDLSARIWRGPV